MPSRTSPRAYTMKLAPVSSAGADDWQLPLVRTHEKFNAAVRYWADFLLTLCGGFRPADVPAPEGDGQDRMQTRYRRIFLALSWLRVESQDPLNEDYRVRPDQLRDMLAEILTDRGLDAQVIGSWQEECSQIFSSPIRPEACWVNRARMFDERFRGLSDAERAQIFSDVIFRFVGADVYWAPPEEDAGGRARNDYIKPARAWLSERTGTGKGRDFARIAENKERIAGWAATAPAGLGIQQLRQDLAAAMGWETSLEAFRNGITHVQSNGPPPRSVRLLRDLADGMPIDLRELEKACREEADRDRKKVGRKGRTPWAERLWAEYCTRIQAPLQIDFNAPALSEAAIRVFSNWSWIKRSVSEREQASSGRELISQVPLEARTFLDEYCQRRAEETGAIAQFRIRRRAIAGWEDIVRAWSQEACRTLDDRQAAVAAAQADTPESFGDARLFLDLAADQARCVWQPYGTPDHHILVRYVQAREAEAVYMARKVPMFRHPDPWRHPAFVQFGNSRPRVRYVRPADSPDGRGLVELQLVDAGSGKLRYVRFRWRSKRVLKELLGADQGQVSTGAPPVPRIHRLALAAAGIASPEHASVKVFEGKAEWNARLQFPRGRHGRSTPGRSWLLTLSAQLSPLQKAAPAPATDPRGQGARLRFSRQPEGLRILGVDLGQKAAAACAVWETVSRESLERECRLRRVCAPSPEDLHFEIPDECGRQRHYRRIASDFLPDGQTPHPSPWARLERLFLIRLPGEDEAARPLLKHENEEIARFGGQIGFGPLRERRVDKQMRHCLREARLYLRRLGNLAKLSWDLQHSEWGRSAERWLDLARTDTPLGRWSAQMWREATGEPPPVGGAGGRAGSSPPADASRLLEARLAGKGAIWAETVAARFEEERQLARELVRWLRRWVAPQGTRGKANRSVGGVSMLRINNLTDLYRVEKMWATLPQPDLKDSRTVPQEFCAKLLLIRDQLRETRVRLIASRILEAAVGLGMEPERRKGEPLARRLAAPPPDPRHRRCDVIAIENLSGYGTSDSRPRRENRGLMNWSKERIRKRLLEGAELLGLRVEEVLPNYTSRQDFRTGAPGIRGRMVKAGRLAQLKTWERLLQRAADRNDPVAQYVRTLASNLERIPDSAMVFVPEDGGDIFVPDTDASPAGGIHADMNAAANIGLKAVLDPDWAGAWWYVPVRPDTGRPDTAERLRGCRAPGLDRMRVDLPGSGDPIRNAWRHPSSQPLHLSQWQPYAEYWENVKRAALRRQLERLFSSPSFAASPTGPRTWPAAPLTDPSQL